MTVFRTNSPITRTACLPGILVLEACLTSRQNSIRKGSSFPWVPHDLCTLSFRPALLATGSDPLSSSLSPLAQNDQERTCDKYRGIGADNRARQQRESYSVEHFSAQEIQGETGQKHWSGGQKGAAQRLIYRLIDQFGKRAITPQHTRSPSTSNAICFAFCFSMICITVSGIRLSEGMETQ